MRTVARKIRDCERRPHGSKKEGCAASPRKHHHIALLKPNPKIMAALNAELKTNVDFDKLADFEGGQALTGYIPGHTVGVPDDADKVAGRSGVTIAAGFDIGQWSTLDLSKKLNLSAILRQKYKRFCNKPKQLAIDELESKGLTVSKPEADETDMRMQDFHLRAAMDIWDADPKPSKTFIELTMAQQTVILSRTYHQGVGMPDSAVAQAFYSAAQKGDWKAAEKALRNYSVKPQWYKVRVRSEADYLAQEALLLQKAAGNAAPVVPGKPPNKP